MHSFTLKIKELLHSYCLYFFPAKTPFQLFPDIKIGVLGIHDWVDHSMSSFPSVTHDLSAWISTTSDKQGMASAVNGFEQPALDVDRHSRARGRSSVSQKKTGRRGFVLIGTRDESAVIGFNDCITDGTFRLNVLFSRIPLPYNAHC